MSFIPENAPFTALPNALRGELNSQQFHILWTLQSYHPNIWPSYQRVADDCLISRRQVVRVIAQLEVMGLVEKVGRSDRRGQTSNVYRVKVWHRAKPERSADPGCHPIAEPLQPEKPVTNRGDSQSPAEQPAAESPATVRGDSQSLVTDSHRVVTHSHWGGDSQSPEEEQGINNNLSNKPPANTLCNDDPAGSSLPLAESDPISEPISALPSAQASNRKLSTTTKLPPCAEPHRDLVTAWWRQRCAAHPTAARELDAASITAIEHADACGVLQPFLQQAVSDVPKSLGHQYRKRVAALMAPSTDGFDAFKAAYLAARKRATNQSISRAITEYGRILAAGTSADQLLAALRANIRAQHEAEAHGGFAACLPDMARWLKGGLWEAYAPQQGASGASAVSFPPLPARRVSEGPLDDPFAHARALEAARLAAGTTTTATAP